MPLGNRAPVMASLAVIVLVLALLAGTSRSTAQDASPTPGDEDVSADSVPTPLPPPVQAFLEAEAIVDTLPTGPATINVTTVVIAPRVALRAVMTNGPVIILVSSGTLTLDADAAIIGPPPSGPLGSLQPDATPAPIQAVDFTVPDGNQIVLPPDTRVQLRNTTDEDVELMIIAVAPEGQEGFGQPAS
jgi:hypothetical protein